MDRYLVDEDFEQVRDTYSSKAEIMDEQVQKYLDVLRSFSSEHILEGETAAKIAEFANLASDYLGGEIAYIMQNHHSETVTFIAEVFDDDDAEIGV